MRIRFGMLATDGFGKAGGQCIQRRGALRVLRNITIPVQRLASTQNPQRFLNSQLFNEWGSLSKEMRDEWSFVGSQLPRLNGWGDSKTLSGREAFTSLNAITKPYSNTILNPSDIDFLTPTIVLTSLLIKMTTATFAINAVPSPNTAFFQMKVLRLSNAAQNPNISKLKTMGRPTEVTDDEENFILLAKLIPSLAVGTIISFAIRAVSISGMTSPWIQEQVIVNS